MSLTEYIRVEPEVLAHATRAAAEMSVVFAASLVARKRLKKVNHLVGHHHAKAVEVAYARTADADEMFVGAYVAGVMPFPVLVACYLERDRLRWRQLPTLEWRAAAQRLVHSSQNLSG